MSKRIAVIYNEPKHTPHEDHWLSKSAEDLGLKKEEFKDASEFGVLAQMESIAEALKEHGHNVLIFSADDDVMRLCSFLQNEKPDAIFNCCESILGQSSLEMSVAGIYELFGIEYTGSPSLTLGIALNKGIAKDIFKAEGIPTPAYWIAEHKDDIPSDIAYPVIVKPVREDASIGIDSNSIVSNREALSQRIAFVLEEFNQPALCEEYIDGRELNVGVIGGTVGNLETLPISEITFHALPKGSPRIVSYEAKWVEESPLYKLTIPECPAKIPSQIETEARLIAIKAARAIGLRDYGRVDMRLRESDNKLFVLEANPNPDISEDAGFMRAAQVSGRSFHGTINEIMDLAIARCEAKSNALTN